MISWVEPPDEVWFCEPEVAVAIAKEHAASRGFSYSSDAEALEDFLAIYWATDEHGIRSSHSALPSRQGVR